MPERAKRVNSCTLRGMGRMGKSGSARQSCSGSLVDQVDDEREILPLIVGWQQDANAAGWIGRHKRRCVIWQYTRTGGLRFYERRRRLEGTPPHATSSSGTDGQSRRTQKQKEIFHYVSNAIHHFGYDDVSSQKLPKKSLVADGPPSHHLDSAIRRRKFVETLKGADVTPPRRRGRLDSRPLD
jgi:hypothetical protein